MSNKQLYVVSKCMHSSEENSVLHFNGYLEGKKIKSIILNESLEIGREYLVKINKYEISNMVLTGNVTAFKELF